MRIGFDIGDNYSQICYLDKKKNLIVSFSEYERNEKDILLRNIVFFNEEDSNLYFGVRAVEKIKEGIKGIVYKDFLENISENKMTILYNRDVKYGDILKEYLKYYVKKINFNNEEIEKITFTVRNPNKLIVKVLREFSREMKVKDIDILSYTESYLYYIFHQDRQLWSNSIGLFDYNKEGLYYSQIDISRRNKPISIKINQVVVDGMFDLTVLNKIGQEEIDRTFYRKIKGLFSNTVMSSIYLTGDGFLEDWLSTSKNVLCAGGRRVFKGQNIYAKGAYYEASFGKKLVDEDYKVNLDYIVNYDIGINAYIDGKEHFYPIIKSGKQWYDSEGNVTVFIDNLQNIEFIYVNRLNDDIDREIISLENFNIRKNKTTKLEISIEFTEKNKGAITIRDRGFGQLYPTTNKIFRKEFIL